MGGLLTTNFPFLSTYIYMYYLSIYLSTYLSICHLFIYHLSRFILRNWLTRLWRLASPKSAGWAIRLETQARADVPVQVQEQPAGKTPSCSVGSQSFLVFGPSPDWMRPTHIMESNLLYSKPTNFNVNLIQKHSHRNIQNNI